MRCDIGGSGGDVSGSGGEAGAPGRRLDYAPARRGRARRWVVLGLSAVVMVLVALSVWRGRDLLARAGQMWQMYQDERMVALCMSYEAPVGQVVFDDTKAGGAVVAAEPACWKAFWTTRLGIPAEAVVFLHGRRTAGGREVLVVVELVRPRSGHGEHLAVTVVEKGTLTRGYRHFGPDVGYEGAELAGRKRMEAGRADPRDAAHFTIRYKVDGKEKVFDGRLVDVMGRTSNGAPVAVTLTVRDGDGRSGGGAR